MLTRLGTVVSRGVTVLLCGARPGLAERFTRTLVASKWCFVTRSTRRSITAAARGIGRHLGTCERSCSPVATVLAQSRRSTRPGDPIHERDLQRELVGAMEGVTWRCADTYFWMQDTSGVETVFAMRP